MHTVSTFLPTPSLSLNKDAFALVKGDANVQIASISEELAKKTEDAARQQEEITHLLSQIVDLQKKAKACAVENEELVQHLGAAKDAQRQLTAEVSGSPDAH